MRVADPSSGCSVLMGADGALRLLALRNGGGPWEPVRGAADTDPPDLRSLVVEALNQPGAVAVGAPVAVPSLPCGVATVLRLPPCSVRRRYVCLVFHALPLASALQSSALAVLLGALPLPPTYLFGTLSVCLLLPALARLHCDGDGDVLVHLLAARRWEWLLDDVHGVLEGRGSAFVDGGGRWSARDGPPAGFVFRGALCDAPGTLLLVYASPSRWCLVVVTTLAPDSAAAAAAARHLVRRWGKGLPGERDAGTDFGRLGRCRRR